MSVLDALPRRAGWTTRPFGRIAERVQETGRPDLEPLSVYLGVGVVPRSSRADNHNQLGEDLAKYLVVKPGDIVFNKLRTWQGGLGMSRHEGIVSPAYFVCRPTAEFDPKFLNYVLQSSPYLQELTRISKWQPPSQFDIGWEQLKLLPINSPSRARQQVVAEFLDRETVHIDALIVAKRRMIDLLREAQGLLFERAADRWGFQFPPLLSDEIGGASLPDGWRVMRLSQVLRQLTNGYVGPTRDVLVDEGIRYVQSLHIKGGFIDFERRPFFVPQQWHEERPRIHLRPNDVLLVQTGDIGQVAVVPEGFGSASCHALQILRVRPDFISGPYLAAYLRSQFGLQSLLSMATGASHPHLEGGIRSLPVVVPPLADQAQLLRDVADMNEPIVASIDRLHEQVALLVERRQALITAAATGEFEVGGAAA